MSVSVERPPPTCKTASSPISKGFGTFTEIDIALFRRSSTEATIRNTWFPAKPHGDLKTDCGSSLSTAEMGKSFWCYGDMINGSRHITVATSKTAAVTHLKAFWIWTGTTQFYGAEMISSL